MIRPVGVIVLAVGLVGCDDEPLDLEAEMSITPGWGAARPLALADDTVLFGYVNPFGGQGAIAALDTGGEIRWRTGYGGSPIVGPGGVVITHDGRFLNATSLEGETLWRAEAYGTIGLAGDGSVVTVAQLDDQATTDQSTVTAVGADGRLAWTTTVWGRALGRPVVTQRARILVPTVGLDDVARLNALSRRGEPQWEVGLGHGIRGALAVGDEGVVYMGSGEGLHALRQSDGAVLWTASMEQGADSPVIGPDGSLYARSRGGIVAVHDGAVRWWSGAVNAAGMAVGDDGLLYVAGVVGPPDRPRWRLVALDTSDGDTEAMYGFSRSTEMVGAPVIADDGTVFTAGHIYYNQYDVEEHGGVTTVLVSNAFEGVLEAWESTAGGLADSPWPRHGADNGRSGLPRPIPPEEPTAESLLGYWATEVGGEQRVIRLERTIDDLPELAAVDHAYALYRYPAAGHPTVTEVGHWELAGGGIDFAPIEGAGHRSALAPSTAWALQIDDPVDGERRAFRSAYAPPLRSSPGGETRWVFADGAIPGDGRDTTVAGVAPAADGSVLAAGFANGYSHWGGEVPPGVWLGRIGGGGWIWTKGWGEPSARPRRVVPDGRGGAVLLGTGLPDGLRVAVLGPDGEIGPRWTEATFDPRDAVARPDGNIVVVGQDGQERLRVVEIDRSGNVAWASTPASEPGSGARAVALDPSGDVLVAGFARGALDFGTGPVEAWASAHQGPEQADNLALLRLSPGGEVRWARTFPTLRRGRPAERKLWLGVDEEGDIFLGGKVLSPLNLGLGQLQPEEDDSAGFVARLDPDGSPRWVRRVVPGISAMVVHPKGNVAIGVGGQTLRLGDAVYETRGLGHFLAELDACGALLWRKTMHCGALGVQDLALGAHGEIVATGMGGNYVDIEDAVVDWTYKQFDARGIVGPWVGVFEGAGDSTAEPDGRVRRCARVAAGTEALEVRLEGTGVGRVVSEPEGIDCPGSCEVTVPANGEVTLTAEPAPGSRFAGWGGACTGKERRCTLAATGSLRVTATFDRPALEWAFALPGSQRPSGLAVLAGGRSVVLSQGGRLEAFEADGAPAWDLRAVSGGAVLGVGAAPDGTLVVAGRVSGATVDAGGGDLPAADGDLFVARYDADGAHVWSRVCHLSLGDSPLRVAVGDAGGVYIAGEATSAWLDEAGVSLNEGRGPFVVRLESDGAPAWHRVAWGAAELGLAAGEQAVVALTPAGGAAVDLGFGGLSAETHWVVGLDAAGDQTFAVSAETLAGYHIAVAAEGASTYVAAGGEGGTLSRLEADGRAAFSVPLVRREGLLVGGALLAVVDHRLVAVAQVARPGDSRGAIAFAAFEEDGRSVYESVLDADAPDGADIVPVAVGAAPDGALVLLGWLRGGADLGDGPIEGVDVAAETPFLARYAP